MMMVETGDGMNTTTVSDTIMTNSGRNTGALSTALVLIAAGVWILALNLGVRLPDIWQYWPVLLIAGGVLGAINYAARPRLCPDGGRLWSSLMAVLVGLLFLGISLGVTTSVLGVPVELSWTYFWQLWPAFPVFAGVAWLAQYAVTGFRRNGLLFVGLGAIVTGVFGFAAMFGLLTTGFLALLWPVMLILAGVVVLAGVSSRRN